MKKQQTASADTSLFYSALYRHHICAAPPPIPASTFPFQRMALTMQRHHPFASILVPKTRMAAKRLSRNY
ncbi:hypothetical protein [Noviherbaspirillum cavernae]|uniref:hypothetical protein n=1 Tax=Noviherbaspirillum cavernae TaxID=2320862 RepID=UPI0011C47899|nr:hypothetical protein [Noviherbaspirillum cavernae]